MGIRPKRRPGTKVERLNLYLTAETYEQVERIAQLRGVADGAAARELVEERIAQILGAPERQREQVPA